MSSLIRVEKLPPSILDLGREADHSPIDPAARLAQWLAALTGNTSRAYARDLGAFAAWLGERSIGGALDRLCQVKRARAVVLVEGYRDALVARGLSSAAINRSLAAINSALRSLARADHGPGRLDVATVKTEARRDTRGPTVARVSQVLDGLAEQQQPSAVRDRAILLLAAARGLRRAEIVGLDVSDLDLGAGEARVLRKGRRERVTIKLPATCVAALSRWLRLRVVLAVECHGALFVGLGGRQSGRRLSGEAVYAIVRRAGRSVGGGSPWRPHGLRHTAITTCLSRTGNDLASVQEFAGHSSSAVTGRYLDDRREREASAVSSMDGVF